MSPHTRACQLCAEVPETEQAARARTVPAERFVVKSRTAVPNQVTIANIWHDGRTVSSLCYLLL